MQLEYSKSFDQPIDREPKPAVLIVDDEPSDRTRLELLLEEFSRNEGFDVVSVASQEEACVQLSRRVFQVVLLDKDLGGNKDGIDSIPEFLKIQPHVQVLMVTGSKATGDVVKAIRLGAFNYITKEQDDELIFAQIRSALSISQIYRQKIRQERNIDFKKKRIVSNSMSSKHLLSQLQGLRETSRPVLLVGENGTGKTTLARILHEERCEYLRQPERPFFSINIAALAEEVVEGELFGTEKGAFTGAENKQGFIELANGGTLHLDEIGDASLDLQKKLLTVLEEGRFFRVGGKRELNSRFHLICSTNRDLEELMKQGRFREDLYMRISTFLVTVPSLRERREDIPDIIKDLLPKACKENNVYADFSDLPESFVELLVKNPPRGNVRGLEQQLSRLLVYAPRDRQWRPIWRAWRSVPGLIADDSKDQPGLEHGDLTAGEIRKLPFRFEQDEWKNLSLDQFISEFERKVISSTKEVLGKNTKVAEALGVSPSVISRKMSQRAVRIDSSSPGLKTKHRGAQVKEASK